MEQNTGPELASQNVKMELFNTKIVTKVVVQVTKLCMYPANMYVRMYVCMCAYRIMYLHQAMDICSYVVKCFLLYNSSCLLYSYPSSFYVYILYYVQLISEQHIIVIATLIPFKYDIMYSTAHIKLDTRVCVHACMHTLNGVYKCIMWCALSVLHATTYTLNTKNARHEYLTYSTR